MTRVRKYQLHDMDQHALLKPITKGTWLVEKHADVIATIYEAVRVATSGEPGPVFVEIPVHLQLLTGDEGPAVAVPARAAAPVRCTMQDVAAAAESLRNARSPTIFVGWGAVDATHEVALLAERLGAPVSTTLQGVSAFPGESSAARRLLPRSRGRACGRKSIRRNRLHAGRGHALR